MKESIVFCSRILFILFFMSVFYFVGFYFGVCRGYDIGAWDVYNGMSQEDQNYEKRKALSEDCL